MRVGITGGIGSGKTTVCLIFEHLGVPVFYADDVAKSLYMEVHIRDRIRELFGEQAYTETGAVDRSFLAGRIFADPQLRERLNALIHPEVRKKYLRWEQEVKEKYPYNLREAAILIESGAYKDCDRIIVVTAPEELRIRRVIERDGAEEKAVRSRMNAQMSDRERLTYAHREIVNDGEQLLIPQVIAADQWLKQQIFE